MTDGEAHRSGFVGVVGRPNVGKSTLVNELVGSKVAIVSPRPQTTRQRILGVVTRPGVQLAFLDTPGFHHPEHALGRYMMELTKAVIQEADVLLLVIDAKAGVRREDQQVIEAVKTSPCPAIVALNKVDLVRKPRLLPLIDACMRTKRFAECIPVSALFGEQLDVLLGRLIHYLPEGPRWYEPSQTTDQSTTQQVGEFIREQILLATRQEVPHAVAVVIDALEERDRVTAVQATIVVERPGQKAIVIGRNGQTLKAIGQAARHELERLLGRKVYLGLWVKVKPEWRKDARLLKEYGYSG